jgi:phage repressor protein C with HTH and peptisase S24 domain
VPLPDQDAQDPISELNTKRLKAVMQVRGLRQGELARRIGISQAIMSRLCTGKMRGTMYVYVIARALSVSSEYLMGDSDIPDPKGEGASDLSMLAMPLASDVVQIELGQLRPGLADGSPQHREPMKKQRFSRDWLEQVTSTAPELLFWTTAEGDAMEPTIRHGEVVLIDRSERTPRTSDGIWAVTYGETGLIRRLRVGIGGTIELHSDNQLIRPEIVKVEELLIIGQVIGAVRKF